MNKESGFMQNIVMIAIILGVVFFSQQTYFRNAAKNLNFPLLKKGDSYLSKTNDWLKTNIYSKFNGGIKDKISGGLKDKEELIKDEINNQKNKIEESFWIGTKKFVAGKVLQTIGIEPKDLITDYELKCSDTTN